MARQTVLFFDDQPLETLLGLAPGRPPTPACVYHRLRVRANRAIEARTEGRIDEALRDMVILAARAHELPAALCLDLGKSLLGLVPNIPRPRLPYRRDHLEQVLRPIWMRILEHATDDSSEAVLADYLGTALYRVHEASGRYRQARQVIERMQQGPQSPFSTGPGLLTNNLAYEYLLERRWDKALPGFMAAYAHFEAEGHVQELPSVRANILTCKAALVPRAHWDELEAEVEEVNARLRERSDWRIRKTLLLLARFACARGDGERAIRRLRQAVRAAREEPTLLREEDRCRLRALMRTRLPCPAALWPDGRMPLPAPGRMPGLPRRRPPR